MCGRYTNEAALSDVRLTFEVEQVELFRDWKPTYNITPSYGPGFEQLIVVRTRDGVRTLRLGRFWMIPPHFNKPLAELPTSFNARAEELAKKPMWRGAFRSSRCLVPATGWREFTGPAGAKQPYHFHFGHSLFAFAGLFSQWQSPDGELVNSFAIVTTEPNAVAAPIHDRMPLVMPKHRYADWLDPGVDPASVLAEAELKSRTLVVEVYPSDPIANGGRYEGPLAIARLAKPEPRPTPVQTSLFGDETAPKKARRR